MSRIFVMKKMRGRQKPDYPAGMLIKRLGAAWFKAVPFPKRIYEIKRERRKRSLQQLRTDN
jgi:hypothetical protein